MFSSTIIKPVFGDKKWPVLISGPCSAETREQVLSTARQLSSLPVDLFRAGIWKPRTRPDSFEGIGSVGLEWLQEVKAETGLKVTTEVAMASHVEQCLKAGIDVFWIGARTTVNPFSVQEIADALQGVDIPVMIKNPISPDLALWIGAFERLERAGIKRMAAIHRGFSSLEASVYRNKPQWQLALEFRRLLPGIELIADPSHICGNRTHLHPIAQKALDLNYDGLMMECHTDPDHAWSDASQQITPGQLAKLIKELVLRNATTDDSEYNEHLHELRDSIDRLDRELIHVLHERMTISEQIARLKKEKNITIYQAARWNEVIKNALNESGKLGLSPYFIQNVLRAIHEESINHQDSIMNAE